MTFEGWIPIRLYHREQQAMVDWMYFGDERPRENFFDLDVQRKITSPFHNIFRRQTPIEALKDWYAERPGLTPAGFIYHISRCGSTLACQALDARGNLALSEPCAIEAVLRARMRRPYVTHEQQGCWLRWMVGAMGQRRPDIRQYFIKFDAWAIAELPLIQEIFPDTPWIFLYRDPLAVLSSQVSLPAWWAMRGVLPPALVNMPAEEIVQMDEEEYCARSLAQLCEIGLLHASRKGQLLVNYNELPEAMWSAVARHFRMALTEGDVASMQERSKYDAKHPKERFESGGGGKRELASSGLRKLAARWIEPVYLKLEEARLAQSSPRT